MLNKKKWFILISFFVVCVVAFIVGKDNIFIANNQQSKVENVAAGAYLSAVFSEANENDGESFLVSGTDGRLDRIFVKDKRVEPIDLSLNKDLNNVFITPNGITIVGGESGTLLFSLDSKNFTQYKINTKADILEVTDFNGNLYACCSDGSIFVLEDGSTEWNAIPRLTNNKILSIVSNNDYIMAITAQTDILVSTNGTDWNISNFNKVYDGFYEKYIFTKLVNLGSTFFVLGHYESDSGSPIIMFTDSGGEVWMFKTLMEIDSKSPQEFYPLNINSIGVFTDQLIAACNLGRILTVTECPTCNTVLDASTANLRSIALSDENMIVVGDNYDFAILKNTDMRQEKIKAEQAYTDFINGAVIVDVRTDIEYNEEHVLGSLHIPVDEIEKKLPELVPDVYTEIIFYCAKGVRSQRALETAQQLGYYNVFNLGGLSDWPYETE